MTVKERNRKIKALLSKEFGRENVRVRGERGTVYGWVRVLITRPKPPKGECVKPESWPFPYYICDDGKRIREQTINRVWQLLKESGLYEELSFYYDDMGDKRKEIIIEVELVE